MPSTRNDTERADTPCLRRFSCHTLTACATRLTKHVEPASRREFLSVSTRLCRSRRSHGHKQSGAEHTSANVIARRVTARRGSPTPPRPGPQAGDPEASSIASDATIVTTHRPHTRCAVGEQGEFPVLTCSSAFPVEPAASGVITTTALWIHQSRYHTDRNRRSLQHSIYCNDDTAAVPGFRHSGCNMRRLRDSIRCNYDIVSESHCCRRLGTLHHPAWSWLHTDSAPLPTLCVAQQLAW